MAFDAFNVKPQPDVPAFELGAENWARDTKLRRDLINAEPVRVTRSH